LLARKKNYSKEAILEDAFNLHPNVNFVESSPFKKKYSKEAILEDAFNLHPNVKLLNIIFLFKQIVLMFTTSF
jgi:hypothetical protein